MKIEQLRQEIESFEAEISSLEKELAAVGGRTLQLASGESNATTISKTIRSEAQRVIEQQSIVQGLRNAIAELNSRLQPKKIQLGELEAQQLRQHRLERVDEGRSRLRGKFTDVEKVAESLKNLFFELKAIALEYERDFAQVHPPGSGNIVLNTASLLNYEAIALPQLVEKDGRFILGSKYIDLFEVEKETLRMQRVQQSLAYSENHKQQMAQSKQRRLDEEMLIARKEREAFIHQKQEQLQTLINKKGWALRGQAATNPSEFDGVIAKLQTEIADLDKIKQE